MPNDALRDRLRAVIAEQGYSVSGLERAMGRCNCWLARKLNGQRALGYDDVAAICKFLDVPWRVEVTWSIGAEA